MTEKITLPTIAELYEVDAAEKAFKQDSFNWLMNQEPKKDWVKENKYAGNSKYIPIGIVETLLQKIFKNPRVEVLREGVMFNAVYVCIRLHYCNPASGQWEFQDGLGAQELQTKAGASAADLAAINKGAVMMALPIAESYAIKDASEKIGKLFGRDLNRKDTMGFAPDGNLVSKFGNNKQKLQ
jgi:hypothetical protein